MLSDLPVYFTLYALVISDFVIPDFLYACYTNLCYTRFPLVQVAIWWYGMSSFGFNSFFFLAEVGNGVMGLVLMVLVHWSPSVLSGVNL